eukprot:4739764-Lingulodinium_polyedra.AAC.1
MTNLERAGEACPALAAATVRSTRRFANWHFLKPAPSSQGKPRGCWYERKGLGPLLLAHTARECVEHGGVSRRQS